MPAYMLRWEHLVVTMVTWCGFWIEDPGRNERAMRTQDGGATGWRARLLSGAAD
jgi:hypothetical protein